MLLQLAFRNLVQARRRSALLGTAIALVTLMLVLLMALSRGITDNLVESATTLSAGHVNVAGFFKPTSGSVAPVLTDVTRLRTDVEAIAPNVDYIVERHRGWGKLVSEIGAVQTGLSGLDVDTEQRFFDKLQLAAEWEYVEGGSEQVLGDPLDLSEPDTVVLFAGQAERLGVGVGDVVTVSTETSSGQTNTADLRVVSVARDLGLLSSFAVFVNKQTILDLYRLNDDTTGALWIYLDDIDKADEVMGVLRNGLSERGYFLRDHEAMPFFFKFENVRSEDWTGQQIDLTIWSDEVSFLTWIITGFDVLSWVLVLVLVVIIAVGIMNSMWNSVRERTREIGTMRAVGMFRRQVLGLFLYEAMLLGFFSAAAGALFGAVIAGAVGLIGIQIPSDAARAILLSDTLRLSVTPQAAVSSVLALTLFTTLAALWPSLRASRLHPVQALTHAE